MKLSSGQILVHYANELVIFRATLMDDLMKNVITRDERFVTYLNPSDDCEDVLGLLAIEQLEIGIDIAEKRPFFFNFIKRQT